LGSRGETPVLQYRFSWKQLAVIAGISHCVLLPTVPGTIRSPQIVEFLRALYATIAASCSSSGTGSRPTARNSCAVTSTAKRRHRHRALPAYAPELNPVEYIWGYLKHHAMPNYCAADLGDVADRARRNLRSMQRRPTLVRAFWQQAELF